MYHCIKSTLLFISIYLLGTLPGQSASLNKDLPPILESYPNCNYTILDTVTAKNKSTVPTKAVRFSLLELKTKARSANADALILIDKDVKIPKNNSRKISDATKSLYHVKYTAELIKLCNEVDFSNKKLTKYNRFGHEITSIPIVHQSITTNIEVILPKKIAKKATIKNNIISIKNGLYGVQLNESYQQVEDKLGAPSVVINIMEDELVIGYGRRHWLHFQRDKLVKIQSSTHLLSQTTLNKVPLHDLFDNAPWKINNKVTANMSLIEVLNLLEINKSLNKENQLTYSHSGKTLKLNFYHNTNFHTGEKSYKLEGFTLQVNDYQEAKKIAKWESKQQLKLVEQMYAQLTHNQEVDLVGIHSQLGKPIAEIITSKDSTLEIFNPFMILETKKADLIKIHLNQESLLSKQFSYENTWALGQFTYDAPRAQLKKHFPPNSYESDNEVEIQADKYTLSLFFDSEDDSIPLKEAELSLWF